MDNKDLIQVIKNLESSIQFIRNELFRQTEFLYSLKDNQTQLEDTMIQLLKEYKAIRAFEKTFKEKPSK